MLPIHSEIARRGPPEKHGGASFLVNPFHISCMGVPGYFSVFQRPHESIKRGQKEFDHRTRKPVSPKLPDFLLFQRQNDTQGDTKPGGMNLRMF
jgi:hypothetical protein